MIGWLRRLLGRSEVSAPARDTIPPDPSIEDEMREYIQREIRGGYSDREGAIQYGVDMFADQADADELRPLSERLVDDALAAHARESANWPQTTDYDRLAAAFAALERKGIVARENFTCCGTCGATEIWDEIDLANTRGASSRGYAFFHMQDTERAVDGDGLYLNYGSCAESEQATVAIAHEIVAEIENAGLKTEWDGTYEQRIGVALEWKRRRRHDAV